VRSLAIAFLGLLFLSACSGTATTPNAGPTPAANAPTPPSFPRITVYDLTYATDLPPVPHGPVLGVASGGEVYFIDSNYGIMRFHNEQFHALGITLGRSYATPEGRAIAGLLALAIDDRNRLYTDATINGATAYLADVTHPKLATAHRLGSNGDVTWMGFDLSRTRLFVAEQQGLEAFDDPSSAYPQRAAFMCARPHLPCRIEMAVEGTDGHVYATSGAQLYELTESLNLVRSIDLRPYVTTCACSIAVSPRGGIWFAANHGGSRIGYVSPDGAVTTFAPKLTYPASIDLIATSANGNVWFVADGEQTVTKIAPNGSTTKYAIDYTNPCGNASGFCPGNAFIGTYGSATHGRADTLWYLGATNLVQIEVGS